MYIVFLMIKLFQVAIMSCYMLNMMANYNASLIKITYNSDLRAGEITR